MGFLLRELKLGSVDTVQQMPLTLPDQLPIPGIPQLPQPNTINVPVQGSRPTFMSSFLRNLPTSLAASLAGIKPQGFGQSFASGLGLSLAGQQQHQQVLAAMEVQKKHLDLQTAMENSQARLRQAQEAKATAQAENIGEPKTPVDKVLAEASDALKSGNAELYQQKLKEASELSAAKRPPPVVKPADQLTAEAIAEGKKAGKTSSLILQEINAAKRGPTPSSIQLSAAGGDPLSNRVLERQQRDKETIASILSQRFLLRVGNYTDSETGEQVTTTGKDAIQQISQGRHLTLTGSLTPSLVAAIQRIRIDTPFVVKGLRDSVSAFDNASDRAIFARVLKANPLASKANAGEIRSWLNNIVDQSVTSGLSESGRNYLVAFAPAMEVAASARAALGITSTQGLTEQAQALLPGPATPDSRLAFARINSFEQLIDRTLSTGIAKAAGGQAKLPKQSQTGRISVIGPDGRLGTIPADQLSEAIKQGYKPQ